MEAQCQDGYASRAEKDAHQESSFLSEKDQSDQSEASKGTRQGTILEKDQRN